MDQIHLSPLVDQIQLTLGHISNTLINLFIWMVADGWCWFVLREKYCWLVAGGWFVLR
jgi:hypothetical protein